MSSCSLFVCFISERIQIAEMSSESETNSSKYQSTSKCVDKLGISKHSPDLLPSLTLPLQGIISVLLCPLLISSTIPQTIVQEGLDSLISLEYSVVIDTKNHKTTFVYLYWTHFWYLFSPVFMILNIPGYLTIFVGVTMNNCFRNISSGKAVLSKINIYGLCVLSAEAINWRNGKSVNRFHP